MFCVKPNYRLHMPLQKLDIGDEDIDTNVYRGIGSYHVTVYEEETIINLD